MTKTPTTQQTEDAAFLVRQRRACLFSEPGTGKTLTAITARKHLSPDLKTLVIAPKIALRQWQKELDEQGFDAAVYRASKDFRLLGTDAFVVTTWALMALNVDALKAWGPVVIIADESHACIDYKSNRTQAFLGRLADGSGLANCAVFCWLLTGTPVIRFADDLWPVMASLFPERLLRLANSRRRAAFCSRFVRYETKTFGGRTIQTPVAGRNESDLFREIYDTVPAMAVRRKLSDVDAQIPALRERDVEIDLTPEAIAGLKAMTKGLTMKNLMKDTDEVKSIRRAFGIAKIAPSAEYLKEIAEPVLVLTWHQDVTDALAGALDGAVVIDGRTTPAQRDAALSAFSGGAAPILIGQIGAVGTALDGLQHACRRVVFVERIGSPALMDQAIARVQRRGQRQTVQVEYLRAYHELETVTDMTLEAKTDTQQRAIG